MAITNKTKNKIYNDCLDCGIPTRSGNNVRGYCNSCYHKRQQLVVNKRIKNVDEAIDTMIEFVDRIERRNGMASMEEVFVELIGHYNTFGNEYKYDKLSTNLQLEAMYDHLKKQRNKLLKRKLI